MKPLILLFLLTGLVCGQSAPAKKRETVQDLIARLTPEQKVRFDEARAEFSIHHYTQALVGFKQLATELSAHPVILKLAAESALNTRDVNFALDNLKPLVAADGDDWQAVALLTRACAEAGDAACRDSGMAHMFDLHKRGISPPQLTQYVLERVYLGDNTLIIVTALEPFGKYHIHDQGQLLDKDNKLILRMTLETDDGDQKQFAQEHPLEAAAGQRRFSFDGYRDTAAVHFTYKMLDGEPDYATVRDMFLKIANRPLRPLTSQTKPAGQ